MCVCVWMEGGGRGEGAVHIEDCEGWWLSGCCGSVGRALAAQARGVLGLTPGDCWPFHFPLFSPHNI